jgi:hypothetical protein
MFTTFLALGLLLGADSGAGATAATTATATAVAPPAPVAQSAAEQPIDPFDRRPVCESLYLASEWQLSPKQHACDWIQNGIFSTPAMFGALWSATTAPLWDRIAGLPEEPYGFPRRFGNNFAQNAFKSTGAYLGGLIVHEDPRVAPPYLIMQRERRPHGFWRRTAHALAANVMSYRCDALCTRPEDVRRVPAISKVTGALASGASMAVLDPHASNLQTLMLRGSASAYAATFANSLFVEFKPEISAIAGKVVTAVFGAR